MASTPITIVLHGLVALVPIHGPGGGNVNHMTALMLDARMNMPGLQCYEVHQPRLQFAVSDIKQCQDAGCDATSSLCQCTDSLAGKDVTLEVLPAEVPSAHAALTSHAPAQSLPATPAEATDFAYVANISLPPYNAKLNKRFLASPVSPDLQTTLLSRMSFDYDTVAACNLVWRLDGGVANVHSMTPRPLGTEGGPGEVHQAMAQVAVARLAVAAASPSQAQAVIVHLRGFTDGIDHPIALASGPSGYRIDYSNDTFLLDPDDPCDDGVARHFAHFFDLTESPPEWNKRLIPHVKFTASKPASVMKPANPADDRCTLPDFMPLDRPACPIASIDSGNP